jgi:hypothetical protein
LKDFFFAAWRRILSLELHEQFFGVADGHQELFGFRNKIPPIQPFHKPRLDALQPGACPVFAFLAELLTNPSTPGSLTVHPFSSAQGQLDSRQPNAVLRGDGRNSVESPWLILGLEASTPNYLQQIAS